ncbi:FLNB protein, partial [Polypterus senegalus]
MPVTEKELAEDAPWKRIQQNTFTRWCNEHLKCVHKRIGNLQTDLEDGLRLIALLEVLSQKKMYRKYNQRPTFRQMKLENVSVALEFLDRENIKLVSIGKAIPSRCLSRDTSCVWTSVEGAHSWQDAHFASQIVTLFAGFEEHMVLALF